MRYLCGLITLLLACCALGWADDEERGVTDMAENPNPVIFPSSLPGARLAPNAPARLVELPPTQTPPADWEGYKHPFFVAGYVAPAPPNLHKAFRWTRIATEDRHGQVGVLVLRSAEAKALRVRFSGGRWDPAVELRVFAPVEQVAFVSQPTWDEDGNWWTTIIFGDAIGLEVFVPDNVASVQLPEITAIAYHFAGPEAVPQGDFEPASGCPLLDVACYPDWRDGSARTVCMLATIDGGGNVAGFCSGNSLTRGPSADFAPIIMTARHCVGTQAKANATVFVWFYQNAACNGTPPNPNTLPRNTGSLLLKTHLGSDWTILGAHEPLATNIYAGWSANYWANNATGTAISHPMGPAPPGGPFKRIAFATKIGDTTCGSTGWRLQYLLGTVDEFDHPSGEFGVGHFRRFGSYSGNCLMRFNMRVVGSQMLPAQPELSGLLWTARCGLPNCTLVHLADGEPDLCGSCGCRRSQQRGRYRAWYRNQPVQHRVRGYILRAPQRYRAYSPGQLQRAVYRVWRPMQLGTRR
jgi:hypothetical protein